MWISWEDEHMDFLTSNSFLLLEKSMGFLWTKQAAILDNIANAETPNYKEKVVTFEETLRGKLERRAPERRAGPFGDLGVCRNGTAGLHPDG